MAFRRTVVAALCAALATVTGCSSSGVGHAYGGSGHGPVPGGTACPHQPAGVQIPPASEVADAPEIP